MDGKKLKPPAATAPLKFGKLIINWNFLQDDVTVMFVGSEKNQPELP